MAGIAIKSFRGKVPRMSTRLLDDNKASVASDCIITNGKLVPMNKPGLVLDSPGDFDIETMFRYKFGELYNWLTWPQVVDVAMSPTAQEALGRFYYTGDGEPRMSTYNDAIVGQGPYPVAWFVLGVAPPETAPTVGVTGGTAPTEARAYVYTFVTQYGEESGPSPATVFTGNANGSWNLTTLDAAPPNTGSVTGAVKDTPSVGKVQVTLNSTFGLIAGEMIELASVAGMTNLNGKHRIVSVDKATSKIVVDLATTQTYTSGGTWTRLAPHNTSGMKKRIYRTVGTNTEYRFVAEIAVATTSYADTVASTLLGETIPSLETLVPPKRMHSLIALANGALAGLVGNELCMSEPYKPHSWPLKNRYSFPEECVALSAVLNSVIVLTKGFPYLVTATVPEAASPIPAGTYAPCVAKRGVVQTGDGCLYPGHDGLYAISSGPSRNVTIDLVRRPEWKMMRPDTFRAAYSSMGYYALHEDMNGNKMVWFLDAAEPDSVLDYSEEGATLYANPEDAELYLAKSNMIYRWNGDKANRKTMFWRSKEFEMPYPVNFAAIQVKADFKAIVPISTEDIDYNTALMANVDDVDGEIASAEILLYEVAGSAIRSVGQQTTGQVQYTLYKEGVPVFTKAVTSNAPFRGPAGFTSDLYAHEVAANIRVDGIYAAEDMEELGQT